MSKNIGGGWTLHLDGVHSYAYWDKVFSKDECQKIIDIANKKGLSNGKVGNKQEDTVVVNKKYRDSNVCWLYHSDDMEWAFQRISGIVLDLNERYFKFDIFGLNEGLQFTNYKAPTGNYDKHIDRSLSSVVRKLSVSVQLTDPKDYEGGDLYLYENNEGVAMRKEQGDLVIFPSYTLHEVKPVTKGERNSLVTWVTGRQFK